MQLLLQLFRRLRMLFGPGWDAGIGEEMRHHREMQRAAGLSECEAARAFGNDLLLRERSRDAWGWTWLDRTAQDLRLAARQMRRAPGFAALAILIFALGIGANTALFSIVNAALLRPLPYPHPDRIVSFAGVSAVRMVVQPDLHLELAPWFGHLHAFEQMALFEPGEVNLAGGAQPERIAAAEVGSGFFAIMGIAPFGRSFSAEEETPGQVRVVVLGERLARQFGNPHAAVGRRLTLNGKAMTVIGVMPHGFDFPQHAQLWVPFPRPWSFAAENFSSNTIVFDDIARLRPGVTLQQARQELIAIAARPPGNLRQARLDVRVLPLRHSLVEDVQPMLWLLLGAVGLVLLIACADVANLQLTRAVARQKEMAVRAALGAGRARLLRQNVTESLLLAALGGAGGLLFAALGLPALRLLLPATLPLAAPVALDGNVLAFTALAALGSGLIFGLFPTWHACHLDLRQAVEGAAAPERGWLRHARAGLAVTEIALALILLAGAGLLLQSFARLAAVNPGFDPSRLLTAKLNLGKSFATGPQETRFYGEILQRIAALPGVDGVALSSDLPMSRGLVNEIFLQLQEPSPSALPQRGAINGSVSADFFRVMGIPVVAGRGFTPTDQPGAPKVAIMDQFLAAVLWPGQNPLGKHVSVPQNPGHGPVWLEVVGVVGDTHYSLDEIPQAHIYLPLAQAPRPSTYLEARTASAPYEGGAALAPAIRRAVATVDPNEPVSDFQTEQARIAASIAAPRFRTWLLSLFAALALLLSAAGIFAVMAFWTARRTAEIGIRMALGADPKAVLRLVVGQGLRLVAVGIALGLIGALALGHLLDHFLFHLSPRDPWTLAAAAALMAATGALACYAPARRAALLNPLAALRKE